MCVERRGRAVRWNVPVRLLLPNGRSLPSLSVLLKTATCIDRD
ncbi:hypothetical protein APY04_1458 [Hyphomicrobium sulfonivorans]|uniref:Uncharacterized protein n=1 Tax=Hyphomicrobium sulfonivorans TaxID=121290 RepID=A0A120CWH4_HYPSL|nr:hypothetical protein APY04_1458 [Hyphomicrobium sulfonivorans]